MTELIISFIKWYLFFGVAYYISTNIIYYFRKETPEEELEGQKLYEEFEKEMSDQTLTQAWLSVMGSFFKATLFLVCGWPYYLLGLDER